MLTCHRAHRLLSEAQDRPLHWREPISLRLHLLLCDPCRRFSAQMDFLRRALRRHAGLD